MLFRSAGNAINQAGMNHAKLKSQKVQKAGDLMGKAIQQERQVQHETHTQMRDIAAKQLEKHVNHAMQKDLQASQPQPQPKKDTKE